MPFTIPATFIGLVRGSSGTDVWVYYDSSSIARWDGLSWAVASPPQSPGGFAILEMRVNGPRDVWALKGLNSPPAGQAQYLLDHWDGATWNEIALPSDAPALVNLKGLWATSAVDVWIAGTGYPAVGVNEPMLLHWDGSALRRDTDAAFFSQTFGTLQYVWASSSTDVWVAGFLPIGGGRLWHSNGAVWTEVFIPEMGTVSQIWGWCAANVWALSPNGIWHYDGTAWSRATNETTHGEALSGTGPDDAWASVSSPTGLLRLQPPTCGDGLISPGEECDPPRPVASTNIPVCDSTCHIPTCGNLMIDPGETCDPPDGVSCDSVCQVLIPPTVCGDGKVGPGEECDPPRPIGDIGVPVCDSTCHIPTCGNLTIDPGETCDPPDGGTCDAHCQTIAPYCGDAMVQAGEGCDFGSPYQICQGCQVTDCGSCFQRWGISSALCTGLNVQDTISCNRLVGCMSPGIAQCAFNSGGVGCYCSDLTCSQATGPCKNQFEALAHTTDPAQVRAQMLGGGPVGKVVSAYRNFTTSSTGCDRHCPPF